jgi:alkylation response protein AidB-like acyl-CoA dehydrogenase
MRRCRAAVILGRGTPEAIERCAVPVLSFEKIGAWVLTAPGAGSDALSGMRTAAVFEGDSLVLNGQKTFISNAPHADVFAIYACSGQRADLKRRAKSPTWTARSNAMNGSELSRRTIGGQHDRGPTCRTGRNQEDEARRGLESTAPGDSAQGHG